MATKSLYQKQAATRVKKALKLRASFDTKVRKYAGQLLTALAGAADAKARLDRINTLYVLNYSPETRLVHDMRVAAVPAALSQELAASGPGQDVQLFNAILFPNYPNALPYEAVFGEDVNAVPPPPAPAPAGPTAASFTTTLTGPNQDAAGVTLAASAGDTLSFNAQATGSSAPASMTIAVGGVQVASVAYLDRYAGSSLLFEHAGVSHQGSFGSAVNF